MDTLFFEVLGASAVLLAVVSVWSDSVRAWRDHKFPQRREVLGALRYEYALLAQRDPAQFEALDAPAALATRIEQMLQRAEREQYPLFEEEVVRAIYTGLATPRTLGRAALSALQPKIAGALWILREGQVRTALPTTPPSSSS